MTAHIDPSQTDTIWRQPPPQTTPYMEPEFDIYIGNRDELSTMEDTESSNEAILARANEPCGVFLDDIPHNPPTSKTRRTLNGSGPY